MESFWAYVLASVGVQATLLIALGALGKMIVVHWLNKEVSAHQATIDQQLLTFKTSLDRIEHEHQVRFTKLHERQAEVIAESYRLLVEAFWQIESTVNPLQLAGDDPLDVKYQKSHKLLVEFYRYFDVHRPFLPAAICQHIQDITKDVRNTLIGFGTYLRYDVDALPPHAQEKNFNKQAEAWEKLSASIPAARTLLEHHFRDLLGHPPTENRSTSITE